MSRCEVRLGHEFEAGEKDGGGEVRWSYTGISRQKFNEGENDGCVS